MGPRLHEPRGCGDARGGRGAGSRLLSTRGRRGSAECSCPGAVGPDLRGDFARLRSGRPHVRRGTRDLSHDRGPGGVHRAQSTARTRREGQRAVTRLRLLHAIHDFLPRHVAGSEIYALELCRELARRHDVFVVTAEYDPEARHGTIRWRAYEGLPVIEIVNNWE